MSRRYDVSEMRALAASTGPGVGQKVLNVGEYQQGQLLTQRTAAGVGAWVRAGLTTHMKGFCRPTISSYNKIPRGRNGPMRWWRATWR
jgi:hypothetical protein